LRGFIPSLPYFEGLTPLPYLEGLLSFPPLL
jgi:hypothetical protein